MTYDLTREKNEAIAAGELALSCLYSAQKELNSAAGWGMWDMLGGGFLSAMIKHSKMDNARNQLERAKSALLRFRRELADVRGLDNLNLDTGDFLSFADWFFDGFLVDALMQDRIHKAKKQVAQTIGEVESILNQLRRY